MFRADKTPAMYPDRKKTARIQSRCGSCRSLSNLPTSFKG